MTEGMYGFLSGALIGAFAVFAVGGGLLAWVAPSLDAGARQQERACHPGMFLEAISNGRVVCVGGKGETWVVSP